MTIQCTSVPSLATHGIPEHSAGNSILRRFRNPVSALCFWASRLSIPKRILILFDATTPKIKVILCKILALTKRKKKIHEEILQKMFLQNSNHGALYCPCHGKSELGASMCAPRYPHHSLGSESACVLCGYLPVDLNSLPQLA